jgi:hypothetical protein
MKIENNLILAKQRAAQAKGQNFYVTKSGIKRDYDLLNGSYIYKVYFKNGIHVEDSKGKKIEDREEESKSGKTTVSQKLRNVKDAKVNEVNESKQS